MMGGKQWKILKDCETFVKTLIDMFDKKNRLYDGPRGHKRATAGGPGGRG